MSSSATTQDWHDTRDRDLVEEITGMVDDGSIKVAVQLATLSKLLKIARMARTVANHKTRVAGWEDYAVPIEELDELREAVDALIIKHRFNPALGF